MKQLLANEDYISFHTHRGFYTPTDQHFQIIRERERERERDSTGFLREEYIIFVSVSATLYHA